MNQEEILNFILALDHQLLAAGAVLLLLLLLFWRVLSRTSRVEREVASLNERLERIREEVRSISQPVARDITPDKEASAPAEEVAQSPSEVPGLAEDEPEEEDVLSRAVASLAAANAGEDLAASESDDSFSFDQSGDVEPDELSVAQEEPSTSFEEESFSFGETEDAPASVTESFAFEESTVVEEPTVAEEPAAVEEPAAAVEAPSGVARLEGDPARPGVSMVRCLSCNYKLAYPEKLAGKRVRCPSCRSGLDLP